MTEEEDIRNTPRGVLDLALRKEKSAYAFYERMLRTQKVSMITSVLEMLRDEERKHVDMVQKMITKMELG